MQRFFSELIGLPLVSREDKHTVGRIWELPLDPETGKLLGILTTHRQIIVPMDLGRLRRDHWEIHSCDAPLEEEELVRLNKISKSKRRLIHKPVVTRSGQYLGRVEDFAIDLNTLTLTQLHVTRKALFWIVEERLIERKQILRITEKAVVVKDNVVKIKEKEEGGEGWKLKERAPMGAS